ncbi:MAG TPA: glycosyltransferase [Solirubrobacteraceae bacterium]|jgi:GT2 family glycosyltransferase|nr:glycosyltransferase [Solirubrobacteraceae bacterium]
MTSTECLDEEVPVAVRLIDIEQCATELRLPAGSGGNPYRRLLALVRRNGQPLGWAALPVSADGTVSLDAVAAAVDRAAEPPDSPLAEPVTESLLSVVVATCANAQSIVRCVEAIRSGATGPYEVIVVENRPARSIVERALRERFRADDRVRYVEERRPGLACARNTGLRAARGELVAFTDDDVIVDPAWAPAIRAAFTATPEVDCVTGLILPLELETSTQLLVERFAGYGKGFVARIYSLEEPPRDQPLFPYTAGHFGSGANMAFRTSVLRNLGGFDPLLGTGTPARGCEDLDICIRVLNAGSRLAYEPRAIVWHRHPDTDAQLRRRAFDYGVALGAMLTKHILTGPNRWAIVSRVPQGIRYYTDSESRKNATRGPVFPRSLTWLERAGLLYGPAAYLASRVEAWR